MPRFSHLAALLALAACSRASSPPAAVSPSPASLAPASLPERAVRRDLPLGPMIRRAYAAGTRDSTGAPGPRYWQQRVDYSIDATLEPATATLRGRETITLHNTSPDTLRRIVLRLYQNYFRAETSRNDYVTDVTQGVTVERLAMNGRDLPLTGAAAYVTEGTLAFVTPPAPVLPGADATLDVAWHFVVPNVPRSERGERMGRWGNELFQLAQWYPQVAMYDDLRGWSLDQYLGTAEFYNQFGSFDVRITVPAGWLVGATGTLANPEAVLSPATRDRLALAMRADTTVHVVTAAERGAGKATLGAAGGTLTWRFTAPMVNDFAFMAARDAVWDATRAMAPQPTAVHVLYEPEHAGYAKTAQFARYALEHHARLVMPYEFPQATVADGPESGMEYPMIIFSGDNIGVTIHELGHQWFPMMVGSNETWYGWMDEGFNDFIDDPALDDFQQGRPTSSPLAIGAQYRRVAGSELEPPMMWPSDFAGPNYGIQAYTKAPIALRALGGVVGDSAVARAFADYARAWKFKHPSPWDFFLFMDRALGRNLDWFWYAWFFTTQTVDQAIAGVDVAGDAAHIRVHDRGDMAMPVIARLDFADGSSRTDTLPASVWFSGARDAELRVSLGGRTLRHVTLDPENRFQDLDRSNNEWPAGH